MMTLNSNHGEGVMEGPGFGGVKGSCDYFVQSPGQPLQLAPHPVGFNNSSSGIDGRRVGKKSSSKPKASKKKNDYHQCQGVKKAPRLIWTPELQEAFVEVYNRIPHTVLVPKKILEQMRVKYPFITRENIASHLQKHRLHLKKQMDKENSEKSSSKSVPSKIPKESNSQSIHPKTSNSNSTNTNSELILQSHSNSTNPIPSQVILQSYPNSTNPSSDGKTCVQNAQGCGFELKRVQFEKSYDLLINKSTNPNSHLSLPIKSHIKAEPLLNHQVHFHFDQTNNVSNQTMMNQQQQPSFNNNVDGGSYIYSNMINVSESQENPNLALPVENSSIAPNSDLPLSINLYPPPISANQISGNGNGNGNDIGFHPIMDCNSFGGWNNSNNDPFLGTLPNFGFGDYDDMNLNFDNNAQVGPDSLNNDKCYPGSYPEPLDFGFPLNFNTTNDFQMNFEQGSLQSMFYPSVNPMENNFTSQQCCGSYNHPLVPHTFDNQWVEQQSNFTRKNEYFPSTGSGRDQMNQINIGSKRRVVF